MSCKGKKILFKSNEKRKIAKICHFVKKIRVISTQAYLATDLALLVRRILMSSKGDLLSIKI